MNSEFEHGLKGKEITKPKFLLGSVPASPVSESRIWICLLIYSSAASWMIIYFKLILDIRNNKKKKIPELLLTAAF